VENNSLNLPAPDQLEITLIGSGGGYGESVLIHAGRGEWMVIDSCKAPGESDPLPLQYLRAIGVDPRTCVKKILCTHWDDDHIRGMADIVRDCESAQFIISKVTDNVKFLQLVALDYTKADKSGSMSATREFSKCLEIIRQRGTKPIIISAVQDRNLWTLSNSGITTEIFALSPSDETTRLFDIEVSNLITEYGVPQRRLVFNNNDRSVVVYIKFGDQRALLGADLEVTDSNETGWLGIINLSQAYDRKASYFKIPHHGSENGHHDEIWNTLLTNKPIGSLTPWNKNNKLPTAEMIVKYRELTGKLYITSNPNFTAKPKHRDPEIEKLLRTFAYSVREVKFIKGIIRSRIRASETLWNTDLLDAALELSSKPGT
jgi:beta-lactamase superfamily II metal-dependent hydrolase